MFKLGLLVSRNDLSEIKVFLSSVLSEKSSSLKITSARERIGTRQRVCLCIHPNPPSNTQCVDIAKDKFTFLSYCHPSSPPHPPPFHHPALLLLASSQEEATMDLMWPEAKERSECLPLPQDSTDLYSYFP